MKKYNYEGFNDNRYSIKIKTKVFSTDYAWTIYNLENKEVFYCKQDDSSKADISIYADQSKQKEVLIVKTKEFIDFSAHYDIFDPIRNIKIGAVRRKKIKFLGKDEWVIMNKDDMSIGLAKEYRTALGLLFKYSRPMWYKPKYILSISELQIGTFKKHRSYFGLKTSLDFSQDVSNLLDRRMGIAIALLLCGIGKRNN